MIQFDEHTFQIGLKPPTGTSILKNDHCSPSTRHPFVYVLCSHIMLTPPKTNMAMENQPVEDVSPPKNVDFSPAMLVLGGVNTKTTSLPSPYLWRGRVRCLADWLTLCLLTSPQSTVQIQNRLRKQLLYEFGYNPL